MKKSNPLSILFFSIILIVSIQACSSRLQKTEQSNVKLANQIVGTWAYAELGDSTVVKNYFGDGVMRRKIISSRTFIVIDFTDQHHLMRAAFMGGYTVENGVYTETINYTGQDGYQQYLGQKNTFELKVNGDFMTIRGINNKYGLELWKRIK